MLAELLLTGLFTAGIAGIIFMLFFNTTKVETKSKKKGKNKKKKPKKNKPKPKKKPPVKQAQKYVFKNMNPALNKPKIKLEDHENLVSVFRNHNGDITGVAWHQSGKYLMSSSKDKHIYVWENPCDPQITLDFIGSVKARDNGYFSALNTIVTKPKETDDEKTEQNVNHLTPYDVLSNSIYATTNGSFGLNSYQLMWVNAKEKILCKMTSNLQTEFIKEDTRCICVSPQLHFIAVSGSQNTKIYFYDMKKKQRECRNKKKIKIELAPVVKNKAALRKILANAEKSMNVIDGGQFVNYEMNISMDGNYLSIGTFKKDIRLWRINYIKPGKRDLVQELRFGGTSLLCSITNAHEKSITCVTFSCDSHYMISSSLDGHIKVWDVVNCDYQRGYKPEMILDKDLEIGGIHNIVMSYEYDVIAVLDEKKQSVYIYQIKYEKKKIKKHCTFENVLLNPKNKGAQINCVRFSPDSLYIAVGTTDFDVRVYKIPAHKKSSK